MDSQHQVQPFVHFKVLTTNQSNIVNKLRYYVTKFMMDDAKSKYFQIKENMKGKKIIFKYFTPEPGCPELAITQNGVDQYYEWDTPVIGLSDKVLEMKDKKGQPLACYPAIVLFHEIAHAAVHYDKDLSVKFPNHREPFQNKLDILKKQGINSLYLKQARRKNQGEIKCISPKGCQICEEYKSELAGTKVGRPVARKGRRKRLGY